MVTTYHPKTPHYTPERIQKASKDLIHACYNDRKLCLKHYSDLMERFEREPDVHPLLIEATKTLGAVIKSTDKIVKVLDSLSKGTDKSSADDEFSDVDTKVLKSFLENK